MIRIQNPALTEQPKTYLRSPAASGDASLEVLDTNPFAAADKILLGLIGDNKTELTTIAAVTDKDTLSVSAVQFDHPADTLVIKTPYNQIRIYRSTTGQSGSYSLLATVDIEWSQMQTLYTDPAESDSYYYKVAFLNSTSGVESALSDPISPSGISAHALISLEEEVIGLVPDKLLRFVTRAEVREWINQAVEMLTMGLIQTDEGYNLAISSNYTLLSNTGFYDFPEDLLVLKRVEVSQDQTNWRRIRPLRIGNVPQGISGAASSTAAFETRYYRKGTQFAFEPRLPTGYYARLWYYFSATRLADSTDRLDAALWPYRHIIITYCQSKVKMKERKTTEAAALMREFDKSIEKMSEQIELADFDENPMTREIDPTIGNPFIRY